MLDGKGGGNLLANGRVIEANVRTRKELFPAKYAKSRERGAVVRHVPARFAFKHASLYVKKARTAATPHSLLPLCASLQFARRRKTHSRPRFTWLSEVSCNSLDAPQRMLSMICWEKRVKETASAG